MFGNKLMSHYSRKLLGQYTPENAFLEEHGFWDYTTPLAGGMEMFRRDDYLSLLDDMAGAGMNSLAVNVKWLTTGYRSGLPFLDQLPGNPVIESDNALLREVIDEAAARGIRVWLAAAVNCYELDKFPGEPVRVTEAPCGIRLPFRIAVFGIGTPGLVENAVRVHEELVELFPAAAGLVVEPDPEPERLQRNR